MRTKTKQNKLSKEIFDMIYMWGVTGVDVNSKSPVYRTLIGRLLDNPSRGFHKGTQLECFDNTCKLKHLPF